MSLSLTPKFLKANDEINSDPLWIAFKNGDRKAFEKIYRAYAKDLLHYGYRIIADKRLIEDSIQDLFFELWQSKENLSHTSSIKFYLFRALRYKIIRNAKGNGMAFVDSLNQAEIASADFSHESHLIDLEVEALHSAHLHDVIAQLPKRQQEAINLRYYHDFTNEEIAVIMEINYHSACKLIYAALKNLKLSVKVPLA
jgi:RNA polymerase sigma factor (sigma-70 family)